MYIDINIPKKPYWGFVNELDNRGLDLDYPNKAIRAIKEMYYNYGVDAFTKDKIHIVYTDENGVKVICPLKGQITEALKFFFFNRSITINGNTCPKSSDLAYLFMENDKYFSMLVTLERKLSQIRGFLKDEFYGYAAAEIGSLVRSYNTEVFTLINQYFYSKARRNKEGNYEYYYVNGNIGFAISAKPYIAIILYKVICKNKELTWEVEDDSKVVLDVLYENYNIYSFEKVDTDIRPSGSFLIDCKKVTNYIKLANPKFTGSIDFHDLMTYGPYNDRILSIENMRAISEIFGHTSWIETFFLSIALYCDNYIKIETEVIDDCKALVPSSNSLVDPNQVENFDLFLKAVSYIDSIYGSIVVYPKK